MKNLIFGIIVLSIISCSIYAQTNWYISNTNGDDIFSGITPTNTPAGTGPVKNITNLFQKGLIQDGDIVNIEANSFNAYPVISSILPNSGSPMVLEITKKITINVYGNGDVIIDMSNPLSGLKFTVNGTIKFTKTGSGKFVFKGSSQSGIVLNSGEILLENVSFLIKDPFLFQSPHSNVSPSPAAEWYIDLTNGNDNNNGLSSIPSSGNIGPLKSIFQVYKSLPPPITPNEYPSLANDIFYIEACNYSGGAFDGYTDGPVFLENVTIIGKKSNGNTNDKVVFNLLNTDMHFSNKMRTIFKWLNGTSQNNFQFLGSVNTGIVFETGCVELNAPIEIAPPFLIRRTPSYCSGNTKIPLVVYGNRVYHTIAIQGNPNKCWLKENLNVGSMVSGTSPQSDNQNIEKYCYSNNEENCNKYGGLYQWAEALQVDYIYNGQFATLPSTYIQGISPQGWHIPSLSELGLLTNQNEGNNIKSVGVGNTIGQGTNITGFSALLAGFKGGFGIFQEFNQAESSTYFWSTLQYATSQAKAPELIANSNTFSFGGVPEKKFGFSVRSVHDLWDGQGHTFRIANIPTGIDESKIDIERPTGFSLLQNYPNPFNPATTITYELSKQENVRINIYDSIGRLIRELVNRNDNVGKHTVIWDGKDSNGRLVSSGNYFYQIISGSFSKAKKMILLK